MIQVDNEKDLNKELQKNEKVIAFFYASWCPFCRSFLHVFDEKIVGFSRGRVIYVLLDDYDNQLWDDYSVEAVPTIIFFEKGKVSKRLDAKLGMGLSEKKFMVWLQELNEH